MLLNSPGYMPYTAPDRATVYTLLNEEKFQEAFDHLMSKMPNGLLSPGVHSLAGLALQKLGKDEQAGFEFVLSTLLTKSILSTGDGSKEHPFLVLHTTDEYDILLRLGKKSIRQSLHENGGKWLDWQNCEDGDQIWFDVSDLIKKSEAYWKTRQH